MRRLRVRKQIFKEKHRYTFFINLFMRKIKYVGLFEVMELWNMSWQQKLDKLHYTQLWRMRAHIYTIILYIDLCLLENHFYLLDLLDLTDWSS